MTISCIILMFISQITLAYISGRFMEDFLICYNAKSTGLSDIPVEYTVKRYLTLSVISFVLSLVDGVFAMKHLVNLISNSI